MPCALALSSTALPVPLSRMTPTNGCLPPPPELPELPELLDFPHAARPPSTTTPAVATARMPLRMQRVLSGMRRTRRRARLKTNGCLDVVIVVPGNVFPLASRSQGAYVAKFVVGRNNSATRLGRTVA